MKNKNILVTGGAGFVGSHVAIALRDQGYFPIIFDNLSKGSIDTVKSCEFVHGDLSCKEALDKVFTKYRIDGVMHFAAFIEIGESMINPLKYYQNNVCNTVNLLECMQKHGVKYFVFSSSASIFGYPNAPKIDETHSVNPISPYGKSKLMIEMMLKDFDEAYGIRSCCLRYFNAAGGDPTGRVKNHKLVESNLIPIILKSLIAKQGSLTLFGNDYPTFDGTCIRDYVHVADLADAHILALEKLYETDTSSQYNLGNGNGFSIMQVIETVKKVTCKPVLFNCGDRRRGDPPILIADSTKAKKDLKWNPKFTCLETIVEHAWEAISR